MRVPFAPGDEPETKTAAQVGESTVTMLFPVRVTLTMQDYSKIVFEPGPQEVPASLADHWYLKANGVKPYTSTAQVVNLDDADHLLVSIAHELWLEGKLEVFLEFAKDHKALAATFEAERIKQQKVKRELENTLPETLTESATDSQHGNGEVAVEKAKAKGKGK